MDTKSTYPERVSRRVQEVMAQAGAGILGVAQAAGIPRSTLRRRLDNPQASPLTTRELADLAAALNVPVEALAVGDGTDSVTS